MINVGCMMEYMKYTPRTLNEILAANPLPNSEKKRNRKRDDSNDILTGDIHGDPMQVELFCSKCSLPKIIPLLCSVMSELTITVEKKEQIDKTNLVFLAR